MKFHTKRQKHKTMSEIKNQKKRATQNLVPIAVRVSEDLKSTVEKYAINTKRTASSAVFHLLDTHPEIIELKEDEKVGA